MSFFLYFKSQSLLRNRPDGLETLQVLTNLIISSLVLRHVKRFFLVNIIVILTFLNWSWEPRNRKHWNPTCYREKTYLLALALAFFVFWLRICNSTTEISHEWTGSNNVYKCMHSSQKGNPPSFHPEKHPPESMGPLAIFLVFYFHFTEMPLWANLSEKRIFLVL
jgi:hypothetical protein